MRVSPYAAECAAKAAGLLRAAESYERQAAYWQRRA